MDSIYLVLNNNLVLHTLEEGCLQFVFHPGRVEYGVLY